MCGGKWNGRGRERKLNVVIELDIVSLKEFAWQPYWSYLNFDGGDCFCSIISSWAIELEFLLKRVSI